MKKYDLYFSREEIKNREDVKPFATFLSEYPDLVSSFDVKEDALQALSQYETVVKKTSAFSCKPFYVIEEYTVVENEYDEDMNFISGGDGIECSRFPEEWDFYSVYSEHDTLIYENVDGQELEECLDLESDDHPDLYAVNQRTGSVVNPQ